MGPPPKLQQLKSLKVQFGVRDLLNDDDDELKEESSSWILRIKKSDTQKHLSPNENHNRQNPPWPEFEAILRYKCENAENSVIAIVKVSMFSSLQRSSYRQKILEKEKKLFFDTNKLQVWKCDVTKLYQNMKNRPKELTNNEFCQIEVDILPIAVGQIPCPLNESSVVQSSSSQTTPNTNPPWVWMKDQYENTINEMQEQIEGLHNSLNEKSRQIAELRLQWENKCREKVELEIELNEYKKALDRAQDISKKFNQALPSISQRSDSTEPDSLSPLSARKRKSNTRSSTRNATKFSKPK